MVTQTSKSEVKRIKSLRKTSHYKPTADTAGLFWIAPNGKAYKTNKTGSEGLREMVEFNKSIKHQMKTQVSLL